MGGQPAIIAVEEWQMSLGERAALEGVLAQVRPELALEIGTAEGGSLARIAAHSREVHSIDLVRCEAEPPGHVTLQVGDSRRHLPELLERFASEGRNVDFVLSTVTTRARACATTSRTCSPRRRSSAR